MILISLLNSKSGNLWQVGVSEWKANVFSWMEDGYVELMEWIKRNINAQVTVKNKTFSKCIFNWFMFCENFHYRAF